MSDNNFYISTIEFVSLDGMIKLWLTIIQIWCTAVKAQSRIVCDRVHKVCPHLILYVVSSTARVQGLIRHSIRVWMVKRLQTCEFDGSVLKWLWKQFCASCTTADFTYFNICGPKT